VVIVDFANLKKLLPVFILEKLYEEPVLLVEAEREKIFKLAAQPFEVQAFELPQFFFILYFPEKVNHVKESINNARGVFFGPIVLFV